jgi:hypothetical protein
MKTSMKIMASGALPFFVNSVRRIMQKRIHKIMNRVLDVLTWQICFIGAIY